MSSVTLRQARFSESDALAIARERWGIDGTARELPSERDQNFRVSGDGGDWVLKLSGESERREALELQNAALDWLARRSPEMPLPRWRPDSSGHAIADVSGPGGAPRFARLLTYLPGRTLSESRPHAPGLLGNVGRFLGRLDRALEDFSHPAARERDLPWNPERAIDVVTRHEAAVGNPARREILAHFVRVWREVVTPRAPRLPRGVVHNDANDWNVLVGDPTPSPGDRAVAGLLDFGDMLETWTVHELAVALAYAMLGKGDPLAAAAPLAAGYHEVRPLSSDELAVIFPLAAMRLCVSVCLSAHRRTAEPENAYLQITDAPAWETLERLRAVPPRLAEYTLRDACGFPPCPLAPAVETWLRAHGGALGPVVDRDLSRAIVFDLSVGSPELESPAAAADTAAMTEKIFRRMAETGAPAAIGRYDEARLVYQSEAFRGPQAEHPEWRTVHLAVDIFAPPGAPVLAPLDGRVHSFRDNAERLDYGPTVILEHSPEGCPTFYTLYGHLTADSLEGLAVGRPIARGRRLGAIGAPPGNGDWPPHLHFQIVTDLLGREGEFPGVAAPSSRAVWLSLSPDPSLVLGVDVRRREPSPAELAGRRRRLLGASLSLSYRRPLEIVRGSGARLYDESGRAYLDVVNNVAHVGHAHPRVVAALARQAAVLNTNTRYLHDSILRFAERLAATLPEPLSVCFFVCSGSEANELALRMARAHTRARGVIVVDGAYHGNTAALIEVSPYKFAGPGGQGKPAHVEVVPMPDDYRGLYRRDDPARGEKFASHVGGAVDRIRERGAEPAAFFCESLLSCGGQIVLPPGYPEGGLPGRPRRGRRLHRRRSPGRLRPRRHPLLGFPDAGRRARHRHDGQADRQRTSARRRRDDARDRRVVRQRHGVLQHLRRKPGLLRDRSRGARRDRRGAAAGASAASRRTFPRGARTSPGAPSDRRRRPRPRPLPRHRARARPDEPRAGRGRGRLRRRADEGRTGSCVSTDGPLHNVIKMKPPMVFSEADAERVVAAYDRVLGEDFVVGDPSA